MVRSKKIKCPNFSDSAWLLDEITSRHLKTFIRILRSCSLTVLEKSWESSGCTPYGFGPTVRILGLHALTVMDQSWEFSSCSTYGSGPITRILRFQMNRILLLFCPSWSCTIICIIFTSLCKNLVKLTLISSTRTVKHWKWCIWHRKASAKTQVSLTRFLQSELKIIHIIVSIYLWHPRNLITSLLTSKLLLIAIKIWCSFYS